MGFTTKEEFIQDAIRFRLTWLKGWIIRKRLPRRSVTEICTYAKISRDMFYRWWNRYRTEGKNGFKEKPKGRPKTASIDDSLKQKVVKLRQRCDWGPNKIAGHLNPQRLHHRPQPSLPIIREAGLNHPINEPGKTWGTRRFQREHDNSLLQADFKLCGDDNWMISYQDDHSRFITGSVKNHSPTGENAILLLERAVKRYGVPEQILTDQGTQFKPARGETSEFDRHCSELGIEHITASVRMPTTRARLKLFIKLTKWSLTCSSNIGVLSAIITTSDLMKG